MKRYLTIAVAVALLVALAIIGCTDQAGNAAQAGQRHGVGMRAGQGGGHGPGHGEHLKNMFENHDANNDGKISKDEFPGPDQLFDRLDANGDGAITQEEAQQVGMGRGGRGGPMMDPAQRWQHMVEHMDADKDGKISKDEYPGRDEAFARIDANGDGFLTEDEAAQIGRGQGLGPQMDPAQRWQHMLERMDADKDGKISKDEFPGRDEMFARIDANGDGFITEDEAAAMGQGRGGRGGQPFARMDQDGDGKVTREEWQAAFDKLDTNGDGVLDEQDRPERPEGGPHGPNAE